MNSYEQALSDWKEASRRWSDFKANGGDVDSLLGRELAEQMETAHNVLAKHDEARFDPR